MTSSVCYPLLFLTSSFIVVPALMEHNSIPGITNTKPGGLRKLLESVTKVRATVEDIESMLTEVLQALKTSFVEPNLISQIFKQVLYNNLTIDEHIENQLKTFLIKCLSLKTHYSYSYYY